MTTPPLPPPRNDYYLPNQYEDNWSLFLEFEATLDHVDDLISNLSFVSQIPHRRLLLLKAFFVRSNPKLWNVFKTELWPFIVEQAKRLPEFFPTGVLPHITTVPSITITAEGVLSLVSNQFLGTLQKQPGILFWTNFLSCWIATRLIDDDETIGDYIPNAVETYLHTLMEYFVQMKRAVDENDQIELNRNIAYRWLENDQSKLFALPQSIDLAVDIADAEQDSSSDHQAQAQPLLPNLVEFSSTTRIGDHNIIDVNFANKDNSFGQTGTQEEILFGMSPEMAPLVLFTTTMTDLACITISNARIVGDYAGYNRTLQYNGPFGSGGNKGDDGEWALPPAPQPFWRVITCVDAFPLWDISTSELLNDMNFYGNKKGAVAGNDADSTTSSASTTTPEPPSSELQFYAQFSPRYFLRDLQKAVLGFKMALEDAQVHSSSVPSSTTSAPEISSQPFIINSGAWGCGAFGGNKELKFLQQWIAINFAVGGLVKPSALLRYNLFSDATFQSEAESFLQTYLSPSNSKSPATKTCNSLIGDIFRYEQALRNEICSGRSAAQWAENNTLFAFLLTAPATQ